MGIYDKIFKPKKLVLSDGKVVEEKRTRTPLVLFLLRGQIDKGCS